MQNILINNILKTKIISNENWMKIVIGICHLNYIRNTKIILFKKKNHMLCIIQQPAPIIGKRRIILNRNIYS